LARSSSRNVPRIESGRGKERRLAIIEYKRKCLFRVDARRTWITKDRMRSLQGARYVIYRPIERVCYNASRRNAGVTRREIRILRTNITSTVQCKWTERERYKARDTYFTDRYNEYFIMQVDGTRALQGARHVFHGQV